MPRRDPFEFEFEKNPLAGPSRGAYLSDDPGRTYRWVLWRVWDHQKPYANFILLNPSTADGEHDDPTIVRLTYRARQAGFGGIAVTNAFAYRATDPKALKKLARAGVDPIGMPKNEEALAVWASNAKAVIVGWGKHCDEIVPGRGRSILTLMKALNVSVYALGWNADGSPVHPLYIPYERPLIEVRPS